MSLSLLFGFYYIVHGYVSFEPIASRLHKSFNGSNLCSYQHFKEHYITGKYFPSSGHWLDKNDTGLPVYQLDTCDFSNVPNVRGRLKSCLATGDVRSIVTMGDSNGGKHHKALLRLFHTIPGTTCTMIHREKLIHEGFVPDQEYYKTSKKTWKKYLHSNYRYCRGCRSYTTRCALGNSTRHNITIEYLGMTMVLDNSLQLSVPLDGPQFDQFKFRALTTQEFYFKFYLADKIPDVIIIFLPFNHAKNIVLQHARADILYFHSLVKLYLSNSTKVFYIPSFKEFENKRTDPRFTNITYDGKLASGKIDALNHVLFDVIAPDLTRDDSNVHGFLDLWTASSSKQAWSVDGVHMRSIWYRSVMSMFFDYFCNK